jgi:hypothetical protein
MLCESHGMGTGLAERVEVLTGLFRVTELKNANRGPGPSYWDRLFKDAWFASVWNAYALSTFRVGISILWEASEGKV